MSKLLYNYWSDTSINWLEDDLQLAVVKTLRQHPKYGKSFTLAADQNAGKRSIRDGMRRKAAGMAAGEPDLRIYFMDGRIVFIEMKRRNGRLSTAQEERIDLLNHLNFEVHVIYAKTPAVAVSEVMTKLQL